MDFRSLVSLVMAWTLVLSPACFAVQRDAQQLVHETAVLKSVLDSYRAAAPVKASKRTEQEFLTERDRIVAALDQQIRAVETSALSDAAFGQKVEKASRAAMSVLREELVRFVQTELTAAQVEALAAVASDYEKYADPLAAARDKRDALADCVAADVNYVAAKLASQWSHYTKADFARDLKAKRDSLSALAYDGGRYDEFFEMSWQVMSSRDGIEQLAIPIALIMDVVLIPFTILIKIMDYFWPERAVKS